MAGVIEESPVSKIWQRADFDVWKSVSAALDVVNYKAESAVPVWPATGGSVLEKIAEVRVQVSIQMEENAGMNDRRVWSWLE